MKIQHDLDSYSIVLDDGTESDGVDFGMPVTVQSGGNIYLAHLDSPTESGECGIKPVIYKLVAQPTTIEEVDFDDDDDDEEDEDPEDEDEEDNDVVERSAPKQL